jgi:DUF1680 family protein
MNKGILLLLLTLIVGGCTGPGRSNQDGSYPYTAVPFTDVKLTDNFWAPRIETNRVVTIPFAIGKNEETGRMDNFRKAAGRMEGEYIGRRFNDTDVYKVLEGVAYSLQVHPDPELEAIADSVISEIAAAQEADGYLFAARTVDPANPAPGAGSERWINLQGSHELYNSGHLFEAAVAYFRATGKTNFLDIATRNADLLVNTFGPDKRHDAPGHQVVEMGLAKMYDVTGKAEYLELAQFFLDQRGQKHDSEPYPDGPFAMYNGDFYKQDHMPVKEQKEAWGHAVRAVYMYSGIADVASLMGDDEYRSAIESIWDNVVNRKLYVTGGVGARHTTEAFGEDYELPNASAYTETCASVGNVFWNQRMFMLSGDAKYIDILERTLYNSLSAGVSLSGDRFFYQNPLESGGGYERSPWFEVSCCPGNIVRFLPSLPGYIYASRDDELYVNLFVASELNTTVGRSSLRLVQETGYPWDGNVSIKMYPGKKRELAVCIRIPSWTEGRPLPGDLYSFVSNDKQGTIISVNGQPVEIEIDNGYCKIDRKWEDGDLIEISFPEEIKLVKSDDRVEENRGKVSIQRGPIVWCVEGIDNPSGVFALEIPADPELTFSYNDTLLNGTGLITGNVLDTAGNKVKMMAIPYSLWANRGAGQMAVWLPYKK